MMIKKVLEKYHNIIIINETFVQLENRGVSVNLVHFTESTLAKQTEQQVSFIQDLMVVEPKYKKEKMSFMVVEAKYKKEKIVSWLLKLSTKKKR